jgi:hypothetical protein
MMPHISSVVVVWVGSNHQYRHTSTSTCTKKLKYWQMADGRLAVQHFHVTPGSEIMHAQ